MTGGATTTIRTLYVLVVLNGVVFRQISYDFVPYARHFVPVRSFSRKYLINYASSYRKIQLGPMNNAHD